MKKVLKGQKNDEVRQCVHRMICWTHFRILDILHFRSARPHAFHFAQTFPLRLPRHSHFSIAGLTCGVGYRRDGGRHVWLRGRRSQAQAQALTRVIVVIERVLAGGAGG
jgi:hypothetical protein